MSKVYRRLPKMVPRIETMLASVTYASIVLRCLFYDCTCRCNRGCIQPGVVVGALFITSAMQEVIFSSAFVCVFVCVFAVADTSRYTCQRGFGFHLT